MLTQLAYLAGYDGQNIVKGETHGMAQMGGPVISTFSCGRVHSPVLLPGKADCLITMEMSEVLRPGFLEMLKEGGTILMAQTKIVPQNLPEDQYPSMEQIRGAVKSYALVEMDVLAKAIELGDLTGQVANVVMMGALSNIAPFDAIPHDLWLQALKDQSPTPALWAANYRAFEEGRKQR